MNEKKLQWLQLVKLLLMVCCAMLYGFGGVEHKELRRFIAPSLCGVGCFVLSGELLRMNITKEYNDIELNKKALKKD